MTTEEPPIAWTAFHRRAWTDFRRKESLHHEAERIAVPNFDWIAAPIDGYADAFTALTHPHLHPRRAHGGQEPAPPA
jgi:hypothetical protein